MQQLVEICIWYGDAMGERKRDGKRKGGKEGGE